MWEDLSEFGTPNYSYSLVHLLQFLNTASGSDLRIGANPNSRAAEVQLANEFTSTGDAYSLATPSDSMIYTIVVSTSGS
jgi:hypothetical protein